MKPQRHPVRGFFGGLLFGLGLAMLLFVFGVIPVTALLLGILALGFAVLGVVLAYVAPVRRSRAATA